MLMEEGRACRKAADWIENVVETEGIDCEFTRVDGYLFPDSNNILTRGKLELELRVHSAALRGLMCVRCTS